MNLDELIAIRETREHKEQQRRAMKSTLRQWKEDAEGPPPVDDPTLPTCPHHEEYLDDEGGCCLCYEQTEDAFAYRLGGEVDNGPLTLALGAGGVEERE